MAYQYEEPNPYARRLAVCAIERLAGYIATWMDGDDVPMPQARRQVWSRVSCMATRALSLYGRWMRRSRRSDRAARAHQDSHTLPASAYVSL